MCIRDRYQRRVREKVGQTMASARLAALKKSRRSEFFNPEVHYVPDSWVGCDSPPDISSRSNTSVETESPRPGSNDVIFLPDARGTSKGPGTCVLRESAVWFKSAENAAELQSMLDEWNPKKFIWFEDPNADLQSADVVAVLNTFDSVRRAAVVVQNREKVDLPETSGYSIECVTAKSLLPSLPITCRCRGADAAEHGPFMKALGSKGVDLTAADKAGRTEAHWAAWRGHVDCLTVLHEAGADLSACDADGLTPAHMAGLGGHADCIMVLEKFGADVTQASNDGKTPLHLAAYRGNTTSVERLLGAGSEPEALDNTQKTAVHWAALGGHAEVLEVLRTRGACLDSCDSANKTAAHMAALVGSAACLEVLLEGGEVDPRDSYGRTPAHSAAEGGGADCLALLGLNGYDLGACDVDGSTPAHWAARGGHAACLEMLHGKGADLKTEDHNGNTPMFWASSGDHEACIVYLACCDL
eukprot:TRINITY_DN27050_c0_g1_i2.p1 TRINITY_DN27050_c0_g1~~TRINITY_DN27050_c0_g1_i2.p1  ORF type:complete len:472 (-),score=73.93 TRINITY_DN27050_c0_g1_i2:89-1504(-)